MTDRFSDHVHINDEREIIEICGLRIARQFFEYLVVPSKPGHWFRVIKVDNGIATIETKILEEKA